MLLLLSGNHSLAIANVIQAFVDQYGFSLLQPIALKTTRTDITNSQYYEIVSEEEAIRISDLGGGYWFEESGWRVGFADDFDTIVDVSVEKRISTVPEGLALQLKKIFPSIVIIQISDPDEASTGSNGHYFDARIRRRDLGDIVSDVAKHMFNALNAAATCSMHGFGAIISDRELKSLCRNGIIEVQGIDDNELLSRIKGSTIDLTLSNKFFRTKKPWYKPFFAFDLAFGDEEYVRKLFPEGELSKYGIVLKPNEFILGQTIEKINLPENICGLLSGRSSNSRLGISIEQSQNIIPPGHSDFCVLQVKNNLPFPVRIYPETRICQAMFFKLACNSESPYQGKYRPETDIRSKYYKDLVYNSVREERFNLVRKLKIAKTCLNVALCGSTLLSAYGLLVDSLTSGLGLLGALILAVALVLRVAVAFFEF